EAWRERILEGNARMASEGQRVLALAFRPLDNVDEPREKNAILIGLVGMIDPPRPEVKTAVAIAKEAGIRPVMITGDHPLTAQNIAKDLDITQNDTNLTGYELARMDTPALEKQVEDISVYARVSPEHKLNIVEALQDKGHIVAMTGDGVNDAPALKRADIGVAMGNKGTDAAREAADLVLTDDNFATIARAVREGRVVFDNIKKSLLFILPTNGGEAGVILLAVFAGLALPVTAGQILWVNLVTTITLALALAFEPGEAGVMRRPPRSPGEPLITRLLGGRIAYVTVLMMAATFAVFEWVLARGAGIDAARTAAVNMLVMGELVYLFNVRHFTATAFHRRILTGNPVALWMVGLLVGLQLVFTYTPPMQQIFHTVALDAATWGVIIALGAAKFLAVEAEKAVLRRLNIRSM
nr:HAD-IC family P-type ATPase [Denitromonas sp.]